MRPCTCDRCEIGQPWTAEQCYFCWLYHNSPKYAALWDGKPIPETPLGLVKEEVSETADGATVTVTQTFVMKPESATAYPSKAQQAANLVQAATEWKAAGSPMRTDEECQRLHAICEACPHFDRTVDRCKRCGCGLSDKSSVAWVKLIGIPDAIKMATHHCPLGKW